MHHFDLFLFLLLYVQEQIFLVLSWGSSDPICPSTRDLREIEREPDDAPGHLRLLVDGGHGVDGGVAVQLVLVDARLEEDAERADLAWRERER